MHRCTASVDLLVLFALAIACTLLVGPPAPPTAAQGLPDLRIDLYRDPADTDPFALGNEITYQIYANNRSVVLASDVRIIVTLPEHTSYVSSSGPGFVLIQAGPTQLVWVRDRLTGFERGWLSFTVRVNENAPVDAGVEAKSGILCLDAESDYTNNESSVKEIIWPAEPDLQVTKHLWPNSDPVAAGNELVYEIAAENWGGTAASSVRITDTLATDCAYVSDDPGGSGFATERTGQTVVWTRDMMAPTAYGADPARLYVHCQMAAGWTPDQWLQNVVEISTTDVEYDYDNNRSRWVYKSQADRRYAGAITSLDDRTFRQLSDAGFDYALYYLDWSQTEPSDDQYYWGNLDHAVWQAWRYNLDLVVRVDRAPSWVRGPGTASAPPANPAKLGEFLQSAAARWPRNPNRSDEPQIHGYVIWNEPNLTAEWGGNAPDPAVYTGLLQAAHGGIKAASPGAWVISAGLASTADDPPQAVDDRTYLQQMYDAGAGSYFDYLGANLLGFAYAPDDGTDPNGFGFARAEQLRAIMLANGDTEKDMFATETGWLRDTPSDLGSTYNWMKVSEADQAHFLARAYHKARCEWGDWMGPMTTWNLDFAGGSYTETDHRYWFGITDENRIPLRAYTSLQNAASEGPADLWLDQELIDPILFGKELRYIIRYTNIGGQPASGVTLVDTLPEGTEYVSDTAGGTPMGDQVTWNLGDVDTCAYEAITLTLRLTGEEPAGGYLVNTVEAPVRPNEPYSDDNLDSLPTAFPFGGGPGGVGDTTGNSSLVLWLRADSGVDATGASVGAWSDQSGQDNSASQGDPARQPVLQGSAVNGQPAVQFDGSDDYLIVADDDSLDLIEDQTLFVVAQTADLEAMLLAKHDPSLPNVGWGLGVGIAGADGDLDYWSSSRGSWFDSDLNVSDGAAHIAAARRSDGTLQGFCDGSASGADSGHGNSPSSTELVIGLNPDLGSHALSGGVTELAAFDSALNQAEFTLVQNYFGAKYDISIANDLYGGDAPAAGDFDLDVAGIGRETSGSNSIARSAGMVVRDRSFLQDSGDYLLFGHRTTDNSVSSSDLPDSGEWLNAPSPSRWERHWYIQVTDAPGSLTGSVDVAFDLSDAGYSSYTPAIASNYRLLRRSDPFGQFEDIATASALLGDQVVFEGVSVADLGSNFTLATLDSVFSPLGPAPTAVQLASLAASPTLRGMVRVEWETATEIDNVGFHVYRATEPDGSQTRLSEILIPTQHPGTPMGAEYTWLDSDTAPGLTYYYWLEAIDISDTATKHGPVSVKLPSAVPLLRTFFPIVSR